MTKKSKRSKRRQKRRAEARKNAKQIKYRREDESGTREANPEVATAKTGGSIPVTSDAVKYSTSDLTDSRAGEPLLAPSTADQGCQEVPTASTDPSASTTVPETATPSRAAPSPSGARAPDQMVPPDIPCESESKATPPARESAQASTAKPGVDSSDLSRQQPLPPLEDSVETFQKQACQPRDDSTGWSRGATTTPVADSLQVSSDSEIPVTRPPEKSLPGSDKLTSSSLPPQMEAQTPDEAYAATVETAEQAKRPEGTAFDTAARVEHEPQQDSPPPPLDSPAPTSSAGNNELALRSQTDNAALAADEPRAGEEERRDDETKAMSPLARASTAVTAPEQPTEDHATVIGGSTHVIATTPQIVKQPEFPSSAAQQPKSPLEQVSTPPPETPLTTVSQDISPHAPQLSATVAPAAAGMDPTRQSSYDESSQTLQHSAEASALAEASSSPPVTPEGPGATPDPAEGSPASLVAQASDMPPSEPLSHSVASAAPVHCRAGAAQGPALAHDKNVAPQRPTAQTEQPTHLAAQNAPPAETSSTSPPPSAELQTGQEQYAAALADEDQSAPPTSPPAETAGEPDTPASAATGKATPITSAAQGPEVEPSTIHEAASSSDIAPATDQPDSIPVQTAGRVQQAQATVSREPLASSDLESRLNASQVTDAPPEVAPTQDGHDTGALETHRRGKQLKDPAAPVQDHHDPLATQDLVTGQEALAQESRKLSTPQHCSLSLSASANYHDAQSEAAFSHKDQETVKQYGALESEAAVLPPTSETSQAVSESASTEEGSNDDSELLHKLPGEELDSHLKNVFANVAVPRSFAWVEFLAGLIIGFVMLAFGVHFYIKYARHMEGKLHVFEKRLQQLERVPRWDRDTRWLALEQLAAPNGPWKELQQQMGRHQQRWEQWRTATNSRLTKLIEEQSRWISRTKQALDDLAQVQRDLQQLQKQVREQLARMGIQRPSRPNSQQPQEQQSAPDPDKNK